MNDTHFPARPPQVYDARSASPIVRALSTAMVGGLLLGPVDLLAQTTLPYPWANLANSGAVWALAALVAGAVVRRPAAVSAAAGLVLLVTAVESYYLTGVIVRHDSTTTLWNDTTVVWLILAVVIGALSGLAGAASLSPRRITRFAAAAGAGSVFLIEALAILGRPHSDGGSNHDGQTAVIHIVLGIAVPLVTLALTRARRQRSVRT